MPAYARRPAAGTRSARSGRLQSDNPAAAARPSRDSCGGSESPRMFFAGAEAVPVDGSVDRQNSVQMVDLMLHKLGKRARRFHPPRSAPAVFVTHAHRLAALQIHEQAGEGEAIVPQPEFGLAPILILWIADSVCYSFEFDVDQPQRMADLDRTDAATEAVRAAEFVERGAQVLEDRDGLGGFADRRRNGAQQRIAKLENAAGRHRFSTALTL